MTTIYDIHNYLDQIAAFTNQEKSDNCGLLVGDMEAQAGKMLVSLDVTNDVIAEAKEKEIDLLISHHPVIYNPIKRVMKNDPLYSLISNNIAFIAMHTNFDVAQGGTTDIMLKLLGFPPSDEVLDAFNSDGTGFGKIVELSSLISAKELAEKCKTAFGCTCVRYVDGGKAIRRIGLCSGGGGFLTENAYNADCDAYICGDVRWDKMIFAANYGITLIDAGHFNTEDIFCEDLVVRLRKEFPGISIEKSVNSVDVCKYLI